MDKLTEGQKLYWRYLIDDNNDEAVNVEIEVVKDDSEIEIEYEIERKDYEQMFRLWIYVGRPR